MLKRFAGGENCDAFALMKTEKGWRLGSMGDMQILPGSRHRPPMKKPMWIIILVLFVCVFLICAYIYPPKGNSACYVFSSRGCKGFVDWLPPMPAREYTDEEIASRVVIKDILNSPAIVTRKSKVAFMFLSPGSLPFEKLWDKFFQVRFVTCLILYIQAVVFQFLLWKTVNVPL